MFTQYKIVYIFREMKNQNNSFKIRVLLNFHLLQSLISPISLFYNQ